MQLNTLAYSTALSLTPGPIQVVGVHSKVVNLLDRQENLLTLHSTPYGISPMGWLLKPSIFQQICQYVQQGHDLHYEAQRLIFRQGSLLATGRALSLTSPISSELIAPLDLSHMMENLPNQTGLHGSLQQIIRTPLSAELNQFLLFFRALLNLDPISPAPLVGMGPGLTPSSDDILVGMFAVAHSVQPIQQQLQRRQCLDKLLLSQLTTTVSAHYLWYASQGVFSTPILRMIRALQRRHRLIPALLNLLSHGHTSGADTLLGLWLGTLAVNEWYAEQ